MSEPSQYRVRCPACMERERKLEDLHRFVCFWGGIRTHVQDGVNLASLHQSMIELERMGKATLLSNIDGHCQWLGRIEGVAITNSQYHKRINDELEKRARDFSRANGFE